MAGSTLSDVLSDQNSIIQRGKRNREKTNREREAGRNGEERIIDRESERCVRGREEHTFFYDSSTILICFFILQFFLVIQLY